MYYAFIDDEYFGSAYYVRDLKKQVSEEMELFNSFSATIYREERCYCWKRSCDPWMPFRSKKKNRPKLPDWVKDA